MQMRRGDRASGEDEPLQRLQLLVEGVHPALQLGNVVVGHARPHRLPARDALLDARRGEFAADVEQVRLDRLQPGPQVVMFNGRRDDAEH